MTLSAYIVKVGLKTITSFSTLKKKNQNKKTNEIQSKQKEGIINKQMAINKMDISKNQFRKLVK